MLVASVLTADIGSTDVTAQTNEDHGLRGVSPSSRASHLEFEQTLRDAVSPDRIRNFHSALSSVPHVAGSPADHRISAWIGHRFRTMGLDVEMQQLDVYLARPVHASLEVEYDGERRALALQEKPLDEDPATRQRNLTIGWNAYSGSGQVSGEVVYANYGRKEDFEWLAANGVEVEGRIVVARYGGNYRGLKAEFAQAAGAVGLIIYTDPANGGHVVGPVYPDGGYANDTYIQRGSVLALPYAGDPLTPGTPALPDAIRLDPSDVALPTIPIQPIGYGAAREIFAGMRGSEDDPELPDTWQGGFRDVPYRLTGGPDLKVHLEVEQVRELTRVFNIVGTLYGKGPESEDFVVVGAHHDAWSFGAGDPNSGTMIVLEAAHVMSEFARRHRQTRRTIKFACWGAEEFGIIGSTEWVEANRELLREHAIAYLNLDMACMGPNFGASAAPSLKRMIVDTIADVPFPGDGEPQSVMDVWRGRGDSNGDLSRRIGTMGGGSDHVAFYCHVGVPSFSMGTGGAAGVSYHSNYETLDWYRQVVGDDYVPAKMLTQSVVTSIARLANADLVPIDVTRYAIDTRLHLTSLLPRAREMGVYRGTADELDPSMPVFGPLVTQINTFAATAQRFDSMLAGMIESGLHASSVFEEANGILMHLERDWIVTREGDAARWYRSAYVRPDPTSGYVPWMLPDIRAAIEDGDQDALQQQVETTTMIFKAMDRRLHSFMDRFEGRVDHDFPPDR